MDDRFFRAFFPSTPKICGYQLRPFCAGHKLALAAVGSPIVSDDPEARIMPGDVLLGLRICAMPYPFRGSLKPSLMDVWRRWRMERSPDRFKAVCERFAEYLADHNSRPELWKDDTKKGGGLTAPAMLTLVATWVGRGMSRREAWEMSLGESVWMDDAILEREGFADIRFAYEGENDGLPEARDMREMPREEVMAQAIRDLGEAGARRWYAEFMGGGRN